MARRVSLGAVGLLIGGLSGEFSRFLAVDGALAAPFGEILHGATNRNPPGGALVAELQHKFHFADPLVISTALIFAALFALRNWSKQADEARPARFRLRSLFGSVFMAWIVGALFGVVSPTFLTWAAVVSATVQLSSVWRPDLPQPSQRVA